MECKVKDVIGLALSDIIGARSVAVLILDCVTVWCSQENSENVLVSVQ